MRKTKSAKQIARALQAGPMTPEKSKKAIREFVKAAKALCDRIAKDRDELRSLVCEYEDIIQSVDDAEREIESAIDTLSQYL